MLNLAWAIGEVIGAPAAANLSQATSDAVPLLALSAIMVLTLRPVIRARLSPRAPARRREHRATRARRPGCPPRPRGERRRRPPGADGADRGRPGHAAQPRRLDLASDEPRPRPPPHRRPHRLPRGAGPRRGGRDLPRGDRHRSHRPAHRPHHRRLPARRSCPPTAASADAVHAHGTKLLVQFNHGGREQISASPRAPDGGALGHPQPALQDRAARAHPHGDLTAHRGLRHLHRHAAEGGLDGVELSISHGYLPAQFLSRQSNRRGDAWDGDARPRGCASRTEVLTAMREAVGARPMAVGARLSADELDARRHDHRRTASRPSCTCTSRGCWTSSRSCSGHSAFPAASTWIAPPPPTPAAAIALPAGRGARRHPAGASGARHHARRRPRRRRPARRRRRRRSGGHDPRAHRRPRAGRQDARPASTDEVIECIGCNQACIGHYHAGVPIGCAVNARTGRELTLARSPAVPRQRPPAGARHRRRTRRRRRRDRGRAAPATTSRWSSASPSSAASCAWPAWRPPTPSCGSATSAPPPPACAPPGVTLQLDTEADAELADGYDAVVLASGARPYLPSRARDRRSRSCPAWDAIRSPQDGRRTGPGRRLGRRLGRPRRRRAPGRRRARRHPRLRRPGPRRDASPVPAQPVPGAPGRAAASRSCTTTSWPWTATRSSCATSSQARDRAAARRGHARPRPGPRPRRRAVGARSSPTPARSASATCWARARSRRRCSRARCADPGAGADGRGPARRADGQADRRPPRGREPGRARRRGRLRRPRRPRAADLGGRCATGPDLGLRHAHRAGRRVRRRRLRPLQRTPRAAAAVHRARAR